MFSYGDYKEILRIIKSTGRQANYGDALHRDQFIIMRHDVEYSVERAYALAKWNPAWILLPLSFSNGQTIPIICCPERTEI